MACVDTNPRRRTSLNRMILLIDNYDSFVHNLARYLRRLNCDTQIIRADQFDVARCEALAPQAIVISPGPKRPEDAGCSVDIIRRFAPTTPILGVCLGHQAIGVAFGAVVSRCGPVHGSASLVQHDETGLFADCPSPMEVGRYHSLAINPNHLPDDLNVTAQTDDGVIMAIRHQNYPVFGVQFHPESILSKSGDRIMQNFVKISTKYSKAPQ